MGRAAAAPAPAAEATSGAWARLPSRLTRLAGAPQGTGTAGLLDVASLALREHFASAGNGGGGGDDDDEAAER